MSVILSHIGDNGKVRCMFPTDAPTADPRLVEFTDVEATDMKGQLAYSFKTQKNTLAMSFVSILRTWKIIH